MPYALIVGGQVAEYPYSVAQFRADNPLISLPLEPSDAQLAEVGIVPVATAPLPDLAAGERVDGYTVAQVGEAWVQAWSVAAIPLDEFKEARKAAIRDRRWTAEQSGTTVGGVPIRTDETSLNKIAGAVALFDKDPTLATIDFEAQPGTWAALDAATMAAIGIAAGRHVQACFSNARSLMAAVDEAADAAAAGAIDIEAGWPA